jgi:hypothetical protein
MNEQWKPVVGFEGIYEVSSLGRVRSIDRYVATGYEGKGSRLVPGRLLKTQQDKGGYRTLDLRSAGQGNIRYPCKVYRLVAEAFIGQSPSPLHVVNHINGIKTDDRPENLEWITQAENMSHAGKHGLMRHGERCHLSKLTDVQVISIRRLRKLGATLSELAFWFDISAPTVSAIINGKTWKHLLPERSA